MGIYDFAVYVGNDDATDDWLVGKDDIIGPLMREYAGFYPTWLNGLSCEPDGKPPAYSAPVKLDEAIAQIGRAAEATDIPEEPADYTIALLKRVKACCLRHPRGRLYVRHS